MYEDGNHLPNLGGYNPQTNKVAGRCGVAFFWSYASPDTPHAGTSPRPPERHAYAQFFIPGDQYCKPVVKVKEVHKRQFAAEWERFLREEEQVVDGTPLENWPLLSGAQMRMFRHHNFRRVEDIAAATDEQLRSTGIVGAQRWRAHAEAFLEAAKTGALPAKLVEDLAAKDDQLAALQRANQELRAMMESVAQQAGVDVSEMDDPVTRADAELRNTARGIDIPDNWESQSYERLKELAGLVNPTASVRSKEDAKSVIRIYLQGEALK